MPRPTLAALLLTSSVLAQACRKAPAQAKSAATAAPAAPAVADCTAEFPGLPLKEIPPPARQEFCRFAKDSFCYCGCPHLLEGCLKDHPTCHHASRMAALALAEVAVGGTAEKAAEFVTGYYDSFKPQARVKFDLDRLPCQGSPDAKLTIVEFSDFDCPHCKVARPLLEEVVKSRGDTRLCFLSFPIHPHSALAAAAAAYAYSKGDFWRLHDLLFEEQEARVHLDEAAYIAELLRLGEQAGLDRAGLDAALHDPKLKERIEQQKEEGHKLGVDGTPFMFLNGRPLPPVSGELMTLTLNDEVEWMANGGAWAKD